MGALREHLKKDHKKKNNEWALSPNKPKVSHYLYTMKAIWENEGVSFYLLNIAEPCFLRLNLLSRVCRSKVTTSKSSPNGSNLTLNVSLARMLAK